VSAFHSVYVQTHTHTLLVVLFLLLIVSSAFSLGIQVEGLSCHPRIRDEDRSIEFHWFGGLECRRFVAHGNPIDGWEANDKDATENDGNHEDNEKGTGPLH
jgi:hypothetical protein